VSNLSVVEQRAYVLTDNKLAELAGWDNDTLAVELEGLIELDFPMEVTGFDMAEIELILHHNDDDKDDADNDSTTAEWKGAKTGSGRVSRGGDVGTLGPHRLACGEVSDASAYAAVDAAMRRWQRIVGGEATLAHSGETFNEIAKARRKTRSGARHQ